MKNVRIKKATKKHVGRISMQLKKSKKSKDGNEKYLRPVKSKVAKS